MSDFKPYGARSFTSGSVVFVDTNGTFNQNNANFFFDTANIRLGVGVSPTATFHVKLPANDQILIDGSSNPRAITNGVVRINHTASIRDTKPLYINVNGAGFGDTHGIIVDYITGAIDSTAESHIYTATIDGTASTGGAIQAFSVSLANAGGLNSVYAFEANQGVGAVIQWVGTFANATKVQYFNGVATYTDVTTGTNQIFADATGILYFHSATSFTQINNILSINASSSITPVFEYWNGAWTAFSPVDMTNGYQEQGIIKWNNLTLSGQTTTTINGIANARIRIRRTAATVTTPPTETALQISAPTSYNWSSAGDITVRTLSASAGTTILGTWTNTAASSSTAGSGMIGYSDDSAALSSGDRLAYFLGGGSKDAAHTLANAAGMTLFTTENWSATATGSQIRFEVIANTTTARVVALTIDQDKSVTFAGAVFGSYSGAMKILQQLNFGGF